MSSVEPPTTAKCVLYTSKGHLTFELWAKECPKTVRYFFMECIAGRYDGLNLLELPEEHIITYKRGNKGLEDTLPVEANERIKFNSRDGILGWNSGSGIWGITTRKYKDTQGQFFPIGKIVGSSIYTFRNMIDAERTEENPYRFLYPPTIQKVEITVPYFEDIVVTKVIPRAEVTSRTEIKQSPRVMMNYSDDEEEEDEIDEEPRPLNKKHKFDIKLPPGVKNLDNTIPAGKTGTVKSASHSKDGHPTANALTEREQNTLKLLASFQSRSNSKSILNRSRSPKS